MDAVAYIAQLKEEALALRTELMQDAQSQQAAEKAIASSLSAYFSSLPETQLKLLTSGISEDVVTAMRQIVTYILRAPSGDVRTAAHKPHAAPQAIHATRRPCMPHAGRARLARTPVRRR